METKKEIKKVIEIVLELLENDERCRNDDKWLILQVWQKSQHIKVFIAYDKIGEMFIPETITRCRRKIQNIDGKFLPTKKEILKIKERMLLVYPLIIFSFCLLVIGIVLLAKGNSQRFAFERASGRILYRGQGSE